MPLVSNVHHHVDPMRYPKVQEGYEGMAQVIFSTQINNMLMDLTKKMVQQNQSKYAIYTGRNTAVVFHC